MSNGIAKRQNSEVNIQRLAAQKQLYTNVGKIDKCDIVLSVIIPIVFAIIREIVPSWNWIKILVIVLPIIMLVISIIITQQKKKKKELAASIQHEFDLDVYQMLWDDKLFGTKKNLNFEIASASKKILGSEKEKNNLFDWYQPDVDSLPQNRAIRLCQKENFNWDSGLRKRYRIFLFVLLVLLVVVPIIICIIEKLYVSDLLIRYYLVIPAFKRIVDSLYNISDDLSRMKVLESLVYSTEKPSMKNLQLTQKELYKNRKKSVKIPDWFYNIFNNNDEDLQRRTIEMENNIK